MQNAELDETQAGIKIAGRNINNLKNTDDFTVMVENKEEPRSLLMNVKKEIEKNWLKIQHSKNEDHGIWSHHFMANRWETVETVSHFIFLGSKITAAGDCSHETKTCLLLVRKSMTKIDSILESRDITLPPKVRLFKATIFPIIMCGCKCQTRKKAEH